MEDKTANETVTEDFTEDVDMEALEGGEALEGEEALSLMGELSLTDLAELFPEQASLSLGHLGHGKWTAIFRPFLKEKSRIFSPSRVTPSTTPVVGTGMTLSSALMNAFTLLASEELRCPSCREFNMEKISPVGNSWMKCLTCGKTYATTH